MTKYLLKRLLHGVISVVIVVAIVMLLVYTFMDRELIFANDGTFTKRVNNDREIYKYSQWKKFGYLDYFTYNDYLNSLLKEGEIDEETRSAATSIGRTADKDSEIVKEYTEKFQEYCDSMGYTVVRLDAVMVSSKKVASGGKQQLFAYKNTPMIKRVLAFFGRIVSVDNIHYVEDQELENRGLSFTLYDPVYNTMPETGEVVKDKFSPAIMGNGTKYKYLVYFDNKFPYVHQNLVKINLGISISVNRNVDVFQTMTQSQGAYIK